MKKDTPFRLWLTIQWVDHCNEFEGWFKRRPDYGLQEYFNKYRWWLKREFKHHQRKNNS